MPDDKFHRSISPTNTLIPIDTLIPAPTGMLTASPTDTHMPIAACDNEKLIQEIDFGEIDDPTKYGWEASEPKPNFDNFAADIFGDALEITSNNGYTLDLTLNRSGNSIEFATKLNINGQVYANVRVRHANEGLSKNIWLAFQSGTGKPQQTGFGDDEEWIVYIDTDRPGGGWLLFPIDLKDVVNSIVGDQGWSFEQLIRFRLRGNLAIAYICIYE